MGMQSVSFSTKAYDTDGSIDLFLLPGQDGIGNRSRRVSVVETLDGGVSISDNGGGTLGGTITYKLQVTTDQAATLRHLIETYPVIEMSNTDGFFTVAPVALSFTGSAATFSVTIITKEV